MAETVDERKATKFRKDRASRCRINTLWAGRGVHRDAGLLHGNSGGSGSCGDLSAARNLMTLKEFVRFGTLKQYGSRDHFTTKVNDVRME